MIVEYTGRQFTITAAVKKEAESGLEKLSKILGENFKSKVILTAEKQRRIAEITITRRRIPPIVGVGEADDMVVAISAALQNVERQAIKHNGRKRDTKRAVKADWKRETPEAEVQMAVGATTGTAVPVMVHSFPQSPKVSEAHLVKGDDCVALRALTIEEAVKECEFRDRGILVFRDKDGDAKVLHRREDGKLELIEVP